MSARPWTVGLSLALSVAPLIRTLVSLIERSTHPEPDPAVVVWAARSPFLDRVLVTAYLTVALAVALTALARRAPSLRGDRALHAALALGAAGALLGLWP
jgi:hypothetical protein